MILTIRTLAATLAVAAPLLALGAASAQNTEVIERRQELMKANGRAARDANGFIRGQTPYDAAAAVEIFRAINTDTKEFATLFPEDSKTGGDTEASPAIWERPADFAAANDKMIADSQAAIDAAPADLEAFRTAFQSVAANCQSCHQSFRVD